MLTGGNAPVACQADPTEYSPGNVTAGTAFTKSWSMLPGTPVAGTVYQIDCELTATFEANALAFGVLINGTFTQMNPAISASAFSSGAVLAGWLSLRARVLSATTARVSLRGAVSETTSSVSPGSGSLAYAPLSQTLTVAAADTLAIGYLFGAGNASQGAASYGSTLLTVGGQG